MNGYKTSRLMMFPVLPQVNNASLRHVPDQDTNTCRKCNKFCGKPNKLPECGHIFCKKCLKYYFQTTSVWADEPEKFACPVCGQKISKPNLPISKWIKILRQEKGSKFYGTDDKKCRESDSTADVSILRHSHGPGRPRTEHRSAVRFSGYDCFQGFSTKLSMDSRDCVYFGGDILPSGDFILADWLNSSVKMFTSSGQFVCHLKLKESPIDVTVIKNDVIVVSLGSRSKQVIYIELTTTPSGRALRHLGDSTLHGYLYSTTRFGKHALGVFEKLDTSVTLLEVAYKNAMIPSWKAMKEFPVKSNITLSSESGIFYNSNDNRLYLTSRRKLYCLSRDGEQLFIQKFNNAGMDLYHLGAITCDDTGMIYIGSDHCVLRVNQDGGLVSVVLTYLDAYYMLLDVDQKKIALIGKQDNVIYCNVKRH